MPLTLCNTCTFEPIIIPVINCYYYASRKGCGTLVERIVHGKSIIAILTDSQVICNEEMAEKSFATFTCDGTDETMVVQLYPDIFFLSNEVGYLFNILLTLQSY
jgi:hypothetical protein